jgi:hypothetical protein
VLTAQGNGSDRINNLHNESKNAPQQPLITSFLMEVVFLKVKVVFMSCTGFEDSSLMPRRVTLSTLEQPGFVIIVN